MTAAAQPDGAGQGSAAAGHRTSPLYDWPGPPRSPGIKFIYPPLAALPFALVPRGFRVLRVDQIFTVIDLLAVVLAASATVRALGRERGLTAERGVGIVLLVTAMALMTEPVQRTFYLGQVELVLMALVTWDVCQPEGRWWNGIGVGIAAGRQAGPADLHCLPAADPQVPGGCRGRRDVCRHRRGRIHRPEDSSRWWLHGLFLRGSYGNNISYGGNQSLLGLIERLGGTGTHGIWLAAAVILAVLGLGAATVLDRNGHTYLGSGPALSPAC